MNLDNCARCGGVLSRSQHGQKANGILRIVCRNHHCSDPPRLATAPVSGERVGEVKLVKVVAAQGPFTVEAMNASTYEWLGEHSSHDDIKSAASSARTAALFSDASWCVLDKDREVVIDSEELQDWPGDAPKGGEG